MMQPLVPLFYTNAPSSSTMESTTAAPAKSTQPTAATEMNIMNAAASPSKQEHQHHHKASRLRGGGAGKDCFMSLVGCFLCFECCEGCCDCVGDIICCPCEMCC